MDRTKSQDSEGGRGRIKSETAVSRRRNSVKQFEKSSSFGNVNLKKNLASNPSIEEEKSAEDVTDKSSAKRLTNLKDFYSLPGQSEPDKTEEETKEETTSPCAEVPPDVVDGDDPFDWVGYSQANSALTVYCRYVISQMELFKTNSTDILVGCLLLRNLDTATLSSCSSASPVSWRYSEPAV